MAEKEPKLKKLTRAPILRLVITKDIIDSSVPKDSNHCMIADAVKQAFPEAKNIAVDLATIRLTDRRKALRYTYLTPRIAQAALVNFDQGRPPEPFQFQLRGAQVTRAGRIWRSHDKRESTPAQKKALAKATTSRLRNPDGTGNVPHRVGGKTPPLQRTKDNLPFSRRRSFGLRALVL